MASLAAGVDARLQNLSVVKQSGLDMALGYGFALAGGRADIGAAGTYIFHILQSLTPTAPINKVVGVLGNPVDFRGRGHFTWSRSGFDAALFANYVDGYTNKLNAVPQHVDSWTTFDLTLGYRFRAHGGALKGLRVSLAATNLFDRAPPYADYFIGTLSAGYDPENASAIGRVVSFQVTKSWYAAISSRPRPPGCFAQPPRP